MELALRSATSGAPAWRRRRFLEKLVAAGLLIWAADALFYFQRVGSTLGGFALLLLLAAGLTTPSLGRHRRAIVAAMIALLFALALIEDPSPLALALFGTAMTMAVLLPRAAGFDDGWRWTKRLLGQWLRMPAAPLIDLSRLRRARRHRGSPAIKPILPTLVLPLLGTFLFLALFAAANPLIDRALDDIDLFLLIGGLSFGRILFWLAILITVWSLLRPRLIRLRPVSRRSEPLPLPGVSPASVTLSLLAFNALFAVQNGLDIAFLWSGAPLPERMTLAEYAHRGAYPLIATALLAGLFVLVTLRPGTATAASRLIRRLVYLWIAQNILLVASTMLRTADYIEAYSLTRLRIAALIWMGLVAVGLMFICWRLWRAKSGAWLINANLSAALIVLAACSVIDLGAVAAAWNVRHAREVGGRGAALDICYLNHIGASALLPLVELESRSLPADLRDRAGWARNLIMDRLSTSQSDWHGWTYRNHRRLAEATARIAERRLPRFSARVRGCDGRPLPPATPAGAVPIAPEPLTAPATR